MSEGGNTTIIYSGVPLALQITTVIFSFLAALFASERCRIRTKCCEMNIKPANAPPTPMERQSGMSFSGYSPLTKNDRPRDDLVMAENGESTKTPKNSPEFVSVVVDK